MKERILNLIPYSDHITREELVEATGLKDRTVRRYISELKKEHTIISLSSETGYRRCKYTGDMSHDEMKVEYGIVKHSINEINSRKKVGNMQLRQLISYLKVLEKKLEIN